MNLLTVSLYSFACNIKVYAQWILPGVYLASVYFYNCSENFKNKINGIVNMIKKIALRPFFKLFKKIWLNNYLKFFSDASH